jgi:hypothetical protein
MLDCHPQQFVRIYYAKLEDFRIATQRVYSSDDHVMRITLHLLLSETKL